MTEIVFMGDADKAWIIFGMILTLPIWTGLIRRVRYHPDVKLSYSSSLRPRGPRHFNFSGARQHVGPVQSPDRVDDRYATRSSSNRGGSNPRISQTAEHIAALAHIPGGR